MSRQNWDKQSILKKLRSLDRQGEDLSYTKLARTLQPLVSAAAYHFGSFRAAVEKAGIDYADVTRRPRWTKQRIIKLIKDSKRRGEDLHWSAVTARRDELGRAAFASLQKRLFGSWLRACAAAGLDAEDISRYRRWDRESVLFELRERHKSGEPLNSGAIQRDDPGLHAAAVRHFGSYDDALRKAHVDPQDVRQRQRWTREKVLEELRAFGRLHGEFNDARLRRESPALYGAVLREFKTVASGKAVATGKAPAGKKQLGLFEDK
jgi:hypothetical protein